MQNNHIKYLSILGGGLALRKKSDSQAATQVGCSNLLGGELKVYENPFHGL